VNVSNDYNKVVLIGRLGADPELKHTQGGQANLRIRMATSESFLGKDNQRQERTDWHTVVVWGKRGEGLAKILERGKQVWVECRLQTRSWEKDGEKRYATEVVALNIGLLGGKGGGGPRGSEELPSDSRGYDGADAGGADDIPFAPRGNIG
jgi:single-strand DNA-binding protein